MTDKGIRRWWPPLRVAIYGLTLAVTLVPVYVAFTSADWYLSGECDGGFESMGIMNWVPLLFVVGLVEVIVAAIRARAWPWPVAVGLGAVGLAVMVLSFVAWGEAGSQSMCD